MLLENVLHEPRTVETFWRGAAEDVGHAHKFLRGGNNRVALPGIDDRLAVRRGGGSFGGVKIDDVAFSRGERSTFLFFSLFERAPRDICDDARDGDFVVALKGGNCAFGLVAVHAVEFGYVVADQVQFLLQGQHVIAATVARKCRRRQGGTAQQRKYCGGG